MDVFSLSNGPVGFRAMSPWAANRRERPRRVERQASGYARMRLGSRAATWCVLVAALTAFSLLAPQAAAQTAPPETAAPDGAPTKDASLALSASKATTFKIATVVTK
jgi:hypothetical protein